MRIMFVGDISLGEYYTAFGHGPRSHMEHNSIFSEVTHILRHADLVVGNLEAPITDHQYQPELVESTVLRGSPRHAHYLEQAGFKVLQVANNHTVQHGEQGFHDTTSLLRSLDILPIGLLDQDVATLNVGDQSVGFLAASDVPDNTDKQQRCYQPLDQSFIERVKQGIGTVDHLFVLLHWGLESSTTPLSYQTELIEQLAALGVRGIVGSHPHLFYEIWYENKNTIAAPSLGNFVFDLFWDQRLLKSGILDIKLSEDSFEFAQIWPIEISPDNGKPKNSTPALPIQDSLKLYNLGKHMRGGQIRKIVRLSLDYRKGNRKLKKQFITKKLRRII